MSLPIEGLMHFSLMLRQGEPYLHCATHLRCLRFLSRFSVRKGWGSTAAHSTKSMPQDQAEFVRVASKAARKAGDLIRAGFSAPKGVEFKGAVDLVTDTDKQCEKLIFDILRKAFPTHKFIGEEGSASQGFTDELTDEPTWLVGAHAFCMIRMWWNVNRQADAPCMLQTLWTGLQILSTDGHLSASASVWQCRGSYQLALCTIQS